MNSRLSISYSLLQEKLASLSPLLTVNLFTFVQIQLFIYYFSGVLNKLLLMEEYRPSFMISALMILCLFPFLAKLWFNFIMKRSKWPVALMSLHFLAHPFIIIALVFLKTRELPPNVSIMSTPFSFLGWFIGASLVLIAYTYWKPEHYEKFVDAICLIAMIVAVECLFDYFLAWGTPLHDWASVAGRFNSLLIFSNHISGFLGLQLYGISLYRMYANGPSNRLKLGIVLGSILVIACQERSIIGGFLIMHLILLPFYLFKGWRMKRPGVHFINSFTLLGCICVMVLGLIFAIGTLREDAATGSSFYDRVIKWTRGIEIGLYYFPVGCGANLAGKYNTSTIVPSYLIGKLLGVEDLSDTVIHTFSITSSYSSGDYENLRQSLHNSHLDLFAEFGLLGLILSLFFMGYPLLILAKNLRRVSSSQDPQLFANVVFAALMFSLQIPLFMVSSGNVLFWIMGILYLHLHKRVSSSRSSLC